MVFARPSPIVTDLVVLDGDEVLVGSSPVATTADRAHGGGRAECGDGGVPFVIVALVGVMHYSLVRSPLLDLGVPDGATASLDLVLSAVTPEAASPKARGGASPVVSARQSARLSQSRLLLDGRVPTIQEKATLQ
ncbi:hypothetical protein ZWY2020_010320 [Hordeum vulgare]|nr:hypothetical protein ZWY2020_010320 [Hordeum vulgare]